MDQRGGAARLANAVKALKVSAGAEEGTVIVEELEATAPVLGLIVDEAIVQDGYMNALTDGYGTAAA